MFGSRIDATRLRQTLSVTLGSARVEGLIVITLSWFFAMSLITDPEERQAHRVRGLVLNSEAVIFGESNRSIAAISGRPAPTK